MISKLIRTRVRPSVTTAGQCFMVLSSKASNVLSAVSTRISVASMFFLIRAAWIIRRNEGVLESRYFAHLAHNFKNAFRLMSQTTILKSKSTRLRISSRWIPMAYQTRTSKSSSCQIQRRKQNWRQLLSRKTWIQLGTKISKWKSRRMISQNASSLKSGTGIGWILMTLWEACRLESRSSKRFVLLLVFRHCCFLANFNIFIYSVLELCRWLVQTPCKRRRRSIPHSNRVFVGKEPRNQGKTGRLPSSREAQKSHYQEKAFNNRDSILTR